MASTLEAAGLIKDGFETSAEIGLFVVRRDDEAKEHAIKVAKLCVRPLKLRVAKLWR